MELVWFRGQKWIREGIKLNTPYVVFGKTNWFNGKFNMPHPEMELLSEHKKSVRSAMQPIYPSTEKLNNKGITNRVINRIMQQLFLETGTVAAHQQMHLDHYAMVKRQPGIHRLGDLLRNLLTTEHPMLHFGDLSLGGLYPADSRHLRNSILAR